MRDYPHLEFQRPWQYALGLRWGGDLMECVAAWMAAAAYVKATEGMVFDPQGELLSPQQVLQKVREMQKAAPLVQAALRDVVRQFTSDS